MVLLQHTNHNVPMRYLPFLLCPLLVLTACTGSKTDPEAEALHMTAVARKLMQAGQYHEAKDTIATMRQRHAKAFQARKDAILLLDSIELMEARDSVKVVGLQLEHEQLTLDLLANKRQQPQGEEAYTNQHIKVFRIATHLDELQAKERFFVRKIEVDKEKLGI